MTRAQPGQNCNVPDAQRRPWVILTTAVAGSASLTALALAAVVGPRTEAPATFEHVASIIAQAVSVSASLIGVSILLRRRGRAPGTTEDDRGQRKPEHGDGFPPAERLEDRRWLSLVEAMVALLDELERHHPFAELAAKDLAEHIDLRIQEILERSGVTVIVGDTIFDRNRHQPEPPAAQPCAGASVVETIRSGLAVGRRVFRRARVRLANGGTLNQDHSLPDTMGRTS